VRWARSPHVQECQECQECLNVLFCCCFVCLFVCFGDSHDDTTAHCSRHCSYILFVPLAFLVLRCAAARRSVHIWYTLDSPPARGWKYSTGFISAEMIAEHMPPPGTRCVACLLCRQPHCFVHADARERPLHLQLHLPQLQPPPPSAVVSCNYQPPPTVADRVAPLTRH
jgi:hypothetical protein